MRRSEQNAVAVTTGVWQVGRTTFIIRAQPEDPISGQEEERPSRPREQLAGWRRFGPGWS
jgi:hypothetical protein